MKFFRNSCIRGGKVRVCYSGVIRLILNPALSLFLGTSAACLDQRAELPSRFDWTPLERVLLAFVDDTGLVNYVALKEHRADLDTILREMARIGPTNAPQLFPTRDAQLAYWINAYNAEVLGMVVDHYPTSSITKIGLIPFSAFFIKRVQLGGMKLTLRTLENQVIREQFHDARIHFAINCASLSCPPLARHIYRAETLDQQLDAAARAFVNDNRQVTLDTQRHYIVLSKIFDWYASDFEEAYKAKFQRDGSVLDYLSLYLSPERQKVFKELSGAKTTYHEYDWGLNDQGAVRKSGGIRVSDGE